MTKGSLTRTAAIFAACLLAAAGAAAEDSYPGTANLHNPSRETVVKSEFAKAAENAQKASVTILYGVVDISNYNHPNRIQHARRGSGVHLHDGYILTARHGVLEGFNGNKIVPTEITIMTDSLEELDAKYVGDNEYLDIAIYKVDTAKLPATWAASKFSDQEPQMGDEVYAIGYPLGWGPSVTYGKVGNTRTFLPNAESRLEQVDMSTCVGSSGGGVFNEKGELAGMVQSIIQTNEAQAGCSHSTYIVPGPLINRAADSIIKGEKVRFSELGILMDTQKMGKDWHVAVKGLTGVSAARRAGVQTGDIILSIGDTVVKSEAELKSYLVEKTKPGDKKIMKVLRNGQEWLLKVTLGPS